MNAKQKWQIAKYLVSQLAQHEFNCQQQHQYLCIMNQSGHYHGMQQLQTFTCQQLGKRGQFLHICKWQYLIKKVLHGPFQHIISTLIPFQSKSIFRNAENGKTGATNQ